MPRATTLSSLSRRELLAASLAAPFGLQALARAEQAPAGSGRLDPPPYTLSINIELMFPQTMSKADRIRAVAANGFTAYSFWSASPEDRAAMLEAQQETGLTCVSIVGTGRAGGSTGFTRPGQADLLLAEIRERVEIAQQSARRTSSASSGFTRPMCPGKYSVQGSSRGSSARATSRPRVA